MQNRFSSRRKFLTALGSSALHLPLLTLPGFVQAANSKIPSGNILVLIELAGGNDGLNTVVPFNDADYHKLRPEIGLGRSEILTLDQDTGLHQEMRQIGDLWERGEVQIVQGVGYPEPNRSHFRSIEIWNSGEGPKSDAQQGWISAALENSTLMKKADTAGLVLGGDMGPLDGAGRFSAMRDEEAFIEAISLLPNVPHQVRGQDHNATMAHVLGTYESAKATGETIRARLERNEGVNWEFPWTDIGQQMRTGARLLEAGVDVPVLKMVQNGYDTHDAQPGQHGNLLRELTEAISAFSTAMREIGAWDQITIVTYSEFGRTARENGSYGTDHGTAAPVFVIGGQVAGGLTGAPPRLDRLVEDDLQFTTDYRSVYGALLQDLWGIQPPQSFGQSDSTLRLLRSG